VIPPALLPGVPEPGLGVPEAEVGPDEIVAEAENPVCLGGKMGVGAAMPPRQT
jgi:hypothetical protein